MICKNCNNEHDGSYKKDFCCKHCLMSYNGRIGGKNSHSNNRNMDWVSKLYNNSWKCKYCGLIFQSRRKLLEHKKLEHSTLRSIVWNKGLTCDTDERVKNCTKKLKEMYANGSIKIHRHPHSKEVREKLSRIRCEQLDKFHNGFPDVKFYKVNDLNGKEWTVRGTWELNIAKKLNELNIFWCKNIQIKYFDEINRRYNPDFYIPSINEYIEVKGYFSPENKKKMNFVVEQYPEIKIRFICEKEYNNFINNKITYNDIPYYKKI